MIYRSVGIVFGDLRTYLPRQMTIFDHKKTSQDKKYTLYKTIESINQKTGVKKVSFGTTLL